MEKEGRSILEQRRARNGILARALGEFSTEIEGLLVTRTKSTRFLRLCYREDGSWLAVAGVVTAEGEGLVCFGNGVSMFAALYLLGRAMANEEWREDRYYRKS